MRKALSLAAMAIMAMLFVLTSCASSSDAKSSYSEEDCSYTLNYVLVQATDRAIPDFFLALNDGRESMVMDEYGFLNDLRLTIPGMDRLLSQWEEEVASVTVPSFDIFSDYIDAMVQTVVFPDPVATIQQGTSSISEFMRQQYLDQIAMAVKDHLSSVETEYWRLVAVQYNSWAATRERLYGEFMERMDPNLPSEEVIFLLSKHLVRVYLNYLGSAEVLIRTTPNPNMDPIAARVLDLE